MAVATADAGHARQPQYDPPQGALSRLVMGMYIFIASEVMFFGTLFGTYYYLLGSFSQWPPRGFEIVNYYPVPIINTVLLISSSFTFMLGEFYISTGRRRKFILWLVVTILLGAAFEVGQAVEFYDARFWQTYHANQFASAFFTMTGFHGGHVLGGLALIAILVWRAVKYGHFNPTHHAGVRAVGIYWHFVDVVWIFLLSQLYLIPNLLLGGGGA